METNFSPWGDRFLEIWNLVFDEFVRGEGKGHDFELVGELDRTAIDTGAGLERLAFIMQDKPNMYEIDEVYPVIAAAQEMSGRTYGSARRSGGPARPISTTCACGSVADQRPLVAHAHRRWRAPGE